MFVYSNVLTTKFFTELDFIGLSGRISKLGYKIEGMLFLSLDVFKYFSRIKELKLEVREDYFRVKYVNY